MGKLSSEGSVISREVHWFMQTLRKDYGVKVTAQEIGVEATELGLEEVENAFIPSELFSIAPTTLLYELMVVDDVNGNVWVGSIAFYPNSPEWCLQVITKNGEVVLRKPLSIID